MVSTRTDFDVEASYAFHLDDISVETPWVLVTPRIKFVPLAADCLLAQKVKMASEEHEKNVQYVDLEGHTVRNYDFLQLSRIPRLDYCDSRVESMIANEVSCVHQGQKRK